MYHRNDEYTHHTKSPTGKNSGKQKYVGCVRMEHVCIYANTEEEALAEAMRAYKIRHPFHRLNQKDMIIYKGTVCERGFLIHAK